MKLESKLSRILPNIPLRLPAYQELLISSMTLIVYISCFFGAAHTDNLYLAVALSVFNGVVSIHMILLFHDCMHGSAFKNQKLNDLFGFLIGVIAAFPYNFIKASHLQHHKVLGLIDGDTEIMDPSEERAKNELLAPILVRIGKTPLWPFLYFFVLILGHFANWITQKSSALSNLTKMNRAVALDLVSILIVRGSLHIYLVSIHKVPQAYLIGYFVPYLVGMALTAFACRPSHSATAAYSLKDIEFRLRPLFATRTVDSNSFGQFLFSNLNFHMEHHLFPKVSRWRLKNFAMEVRPQLLKFARENNLPLLIHPSYFDWYAQHSASRKSLYNPSTNFENFVSSNEPLNPLFIPSLEIPLEVKNAN
ncbi:MAG: fatty acid desaturase [Bdellovibrionota bacterium]